MTNALYFGDNLDVLKQRIADESVDLIYLDPPFNSDATYNVLFKAVHGERSTAQAEAFRDTWDWGQSAEEAYDDLRQQGGPLFLLVDGLRRVLHESSLMAYVSMMAVRLVELYRVLKPTGSLYLHCDPTASHYLKIVLDCIFGRERFTNEIIWKRTTPKGLASTRFAANSDTILLFRKSDKFTWNPQYSPYSEEYQSRFSLIDEKSGHKFQATSLINPNKNRPNLTYEFHGHTRVWRWTKERMLVAEREGRIYFPPSGGVPREKRFLGDQEGVPVSSLWADIAPVNAVAQERLGYPTQKPLALLERIVRASTNEGDLVLDPFCGCGTTVHAAEALRRNWIGIDVAHHAVTLIEDRLKRAFPSLRPLVYGRPSTLDGAVDLARRDKHQFQWWACWLVGCQVFRDAKKGADRGIDADVFFANGPFGAGRAIVSVKGGDNVSPAMVRDLHGVVEREGATMGVFVTLAEPTPAMLKEAVSAGFVDRSAHGRLPRIQIVTIQQLLDGAKPVPGVIQPRFVEAAAKSPKRRRPDPRQGELLLPMPSRPIRKEEIVAPGFEAWKEAAT